MEKLNCFRRNVVLLTSLLLSCVAHANVTQVSDSVLMSGDGYQLKKISYVDEKGKSRTVEQYYINDVNGALNAYLSAGLPYEEVVAIQKEVDDWGGAWGSSTSNANARTAATATPEFTWVIDRRGATMTTDAEAQQYINDFELQNVVAEEATVPNGDASTTSAATTNASARFSLKLCAGWRSGDKHFNRSIDENFSHDKTFGTGIATLNFKGKLDLDASVNLDLFYDYYRNFACIPYKFRFKQLDAKANYEAIGDFSLTGKVEKNFGNYDWKIAEPKIMDIWFAIGPVPVRVAMDLPIEVGTGSINVKVVGQVATYKAIHFKGDFVYSCTSSSCNKISSNHQDFNNSLQSSLGASLSATVSLQPYVHVAAKPYLYGEWFFYAQLGVKPSFPIELYGYYGNLCEDGDNNGTNETVAAALATLAFEVGITGESKIFGQYILRPKYEKLWYKDLLMIDFLNPGSSAFTPLLRPNVVANQLNVSLPVTTRSCVREYTNRFPVNYSVNWGDGSTNALNNVSSSQQLTHSYARAGTYPITVSYKNGVSTTVNVTVSDDWGGAW